VSDAVRLDRSLATAAVESERHGQQRLQGIALCASGWADVGFEVFFV
jgi:hypothetical protein